MITSENIYSLCEYAVIIKLGDDISLQTHKKVMALNALCKQHAFSGMTETVPSYHTLTVYYQPEKIDHIFPSYFVKEFLLDLASQINVPSDEYQKPVKAIPVCYEADFGLDLAHIAQSKGISKEEVINAHTQQEYQVFVLGFMPGFPYMGIVDEGIASPRKETPRSKVEAGSVGIAGKQTGIYPFDSPGGWQIIGKTPLKLFDPFRKSPFLLTTGDKVKFYSISRKEWDSHVEQNIQPDKINIQNPDATILKTNLLTTIQDLGRFGYQCYGVPVGGVMDIESAMLANFLVGNIPNAAVIECVMGGFKIQFHTASTIALTGYGMGLLNNKAIDYYKAIELKQEDILEIRYQGIGMRTYLAVRGGFDSELIMNSRSTYLRAGIGQSLQNNPQLNFGNLINPAPYKYYKHHLTPLENIVKIRVTAGRELDWLDKESQEKIFQIPFTLGLAIDRMGYRLESEPLKLMNQSSLLSTATTKGTIQITPNGQLIILMSDSQTIGGYPRIGQIAYVDLPILAQLKPKDRILFIPVSSESAEILYLAQQKDWNELFN